MTCQTIEKLIRQVANGTNHEIEPCPFCNESHPAVMMIDEFSFGSYSFIRLSCGNCNASGGDFFFGGEDSLEDAVNEATSRWNTVAKTYRSLESKKEGI